jgi:cyclopropane-fatty-acyl-phospholipid synthase
VTGRAADMIAIVNALARASLKPHGVLSRAARSLLPAHTRALDAEAIRYHYDVSNEFYGAWLDPAWCTPAPISKTATKTWPRRS